MNKLALSIRAQKSKQTRYISKHNYHEQVSK